MTLSIFQYPRGRVYVWVEDTGAREVLQILCRDPRISFHIARGKDGVHAQVNLVKGKAEEESIVYGIVDRDWDGGNETQWPDPQVRIFRLPVHEVENLLLDDQAIASEAGIAETEVRRLLQQAATQLLWWMAAKSYLYAINRQLVNGFPADPAQTLTTRNQAIAFLEDIDFWPVAAETIRSAADPNARNVRLDMLAGRLQDDLRSDAWRDSFSGKEILRLARAQIPGLNHPKRGSSTEIDLDLAKRIARRLAREQRTPRRMDNLFDALRIKAGLQAN